MALDGGLAISEAVTLSCSGCSGPSYCFSLARLCVHCISTWLIGCSCTRLAQTGHASWGARRHDRAKVARGLGQEAMFTFQRSCQVLTTWPVPSTSKSPRQAGIAAALWEQSPNLAYRNPDSKVPGTCGLAKTLLTNEPLTRPHATRCSLASTCIYYDGSSIDDVLAAQLCLDTSEAFRLQRMPAGARLTKDAAFFYRHGAISALQDLRFV